MAGHVGLTEEEQALMEKLGIYRYDDPGDIPEEDVDEAIGYDMNGKVVEHWVKGKLVYRAKEE